MYKLTDAMLIELFGEDNYHYAINESTRLAGNGFYDVILAVLLKKVMDDQAKLLKAQVNTSGL